MDKEKLKYVLENSGKMMINVVFEIFGFMFNMILMLGSISAMLLFIKIYPEIYKITVYPFIKLLFILGWSGIWVLLSGVIFLEIKWSIDFVEKYKERQEEKYQERKNELIEEIEKRLSKKDSKKKK